MAINFEQLAQSMGFTGAAADQLARSLQAASNSADRSVTALEAQNAVISGLISRQNKLQQSTGAVADQLEQFASTLISSADAMATSNTVFTQISPMITFAGKAIKNLGSFGEELGAALGTAFGGIKGKIIGEKLGNYAGVFVGEVAEMAAAVFNQYLQQGEKIMSAFNTLSTVGVTFGGSLTEMQDIIRKTGMPLEMLAKVAQSNAENLALLGGGVSGALERVAKAARNDLGPQLVTLYGGFANLSDELTDYMAMERRRGVNQDLLSEDNIESTRAYLYQLKEISALTGKSSKQLKQEIEQRSRNAATQGMLSKMSETQRKQYDAAMLKVPDAVKGPLQDAFLAFSRGMEPVSTEFLQLQAAAPEAAESIRRMALAANRGPEEFNKVMDQESKNLTVSAGKLTEQMGDLFYLQQAGRLSSSLVDTLNKVITDINSNAARLKTMGEDSAKFAEEMRKLAKESTTFTTSVESIYASQTRLAVTLNGLILGANGYTSKFDTFAKVAVTATDVMNTFVSKFDQFISAILQIKQAQGSATGTEGFTDAQRAEVATNPNRRAEIIAEKDVVRAKKNIEELQNEIKNAWFDATRESAKRELEVQQERLKKDERKLEELRNKQLSVPDTEVPTNKSSDNNTTVPSAQNNDQSTSSLITTTPDESDRQAMIIFERAMEKNQVVLSKLAESVTSQGEQIRRAVDRMA